MNDVIRDMKKLRKDERKAKEDLDYATKILNQKLAAKAVAKRRKTIAIRNWLP